MEKLALRNNDKNLLKVNYAKCLCDDDFKELTDKLEISSDIKMKYTSRLMEAVNEQKKL